MSPGSVSAGLPTVRQIRMVARLIPGLLGYL
jgi:hypothetical protein